MTKPLILRMRRSRDLQKSTSSSGLQANSSCAGPRNTYNRDMNNAANTKRISNSNVKPRYWGKLIKPGMSREERREAMAKFLAAHGVA